MLPYRSAAKPRGSWHLAEGSWRLRSEEHTSELQSRGHLVCRLLLEKKNDAELGEVPGGEVFFIFCINANGHSHNGYHLVLEAMNHTRSATRAVHSRCDDDLALRHIT